jgi:cyclopropane fatty-acyl-phospholipid synthase-like methyltransferase
MKSPTNRVDDAWKTDELVKTFLEGIRGGIPLHDVQIDVMLRLIGACKRPVKNLLDLGCGDGVLTLAVLSKYPEARATLVDFSEPMLKEAKKRSASRKDKTGIIKADFATPDWQKAVKARAPFDAVVSGYAIHHQTDERKQALFSEIFGLLASGGIFVNMDHVASRSEWGRSASDTHFVDSLYAFHAERGIGESYEEVAERFHSRTDKEANVLSTVEDQCEWLRNSGFENVDCFFKIFELAVFSGTHP